MKSPTSLTDLLLSRDRRMRGAVQLCLTSLVTYVIYGALSFVQVGMGFMPAGAAIAFVGAALVMNGAIYVAVRSGWSQRFRSDPWLGHLQLLLGIVFFWITYATSGPAAPSTLIIVASHMIYAVFAFPAKRVRALAIGSLVGLAAVMAGCHAWQPERYPAPQQLVALLYTSLVVALITRLTHQVASMQERMRSQKDQLQVALAQVQALAGRDEVTGLPNRRNMLDRLANARAQLGRGSGPACVALLDIDHFKRINDLHGHAAGDDVLRRFAALANGVLREADGMARWGGEEFLMLMPQTDLRAGESAIQRLRSALASASFGAADAPFAVTFSAGVTLLSEQGSLESCIDRADRAMYRAKQAGRDRVVVDDAAEARAIAEPA